MRHYEIVFLVHPDQADQTQSVLDKFSSLVSNSGGTIHRLENIGTRKLAYPIQDQFKASYILMNLECDKHVIEEIKNSFKFNDSIIRNIVLSRKKPYTELSNLSAQTETEPVEDYFQENAFKKTQDNGKETKTRKEDN